MTGRMALMAAASFLAGSAQAYAQACENDYYNHNGSQMRAERCGDRLSIYYDAPRQVIARQGVRPGTLLFDGFVTRNGTFEFIEGTARVFKAGCAEATFRVEGGYTADGVPGPDPIYLAGVAPVRNSRCVVTGSRNETLDFD